MKTFVSCLEWQLYYLNILVRIATIIRFNVRRVEICIELNSFILQRSTLFSRSTASETYVRPTEDCFQSKSPSSNNGSLTHHYLLMHSHFPRKTHLLIHLSCVSFIWNKQSPYYPPPNSQKSDSANPTLAKRP